MLKEPILISVFVAFISSCGYEKTFEAIEVDGKFSIEVPDYLRECSDLSEEAVFQYKNRYRSFYVLVFVEENKKTPLKKFARSEVQELATLLIDSAISKPQAINLNGTKGWQHITSGRLDEKFVYYIHSFVESEKARYKIVLWTLDEKKVTHLPDFQYIINSFREI